MNNQARPGHMSAWTKIKMGWADPIVISHDGTYMAEAAELANVFYRIDHGYLPGEYLLLEHRKSIPLDFDENFWDPGGMIIYHIDENNYNQNVAFGDTMRGGTFQQDWPMNSQHFPFAVLQRDGAYDLEQFSNGGHPDDYYYLPEHRLGPGNGEPIHSSSGIYPNTDSYAFGQVTVTGLTIHNFQQVMGQNIMTFDIVGIGDSLPPRASPFESFAPTMIPSTSVIVPDQIMVPTLPFSTPQTNAPTVTPTVTPTVSPTVSPTESPTSSPTLSPATLSPAAFLSPTLVATPSSTILSISTTTTPQPTTTSSTSSVSSANKNAKRSKKSSKSTKSGGYRISKSGNYGKIGKRGKRGKRSYQGEADDDNGKDGNGMSRGQGGDPETSDDINQSSQGSNNSNNNNNNNGSRGSRRRGFFPSSPHPTPPPGTRAGRLTPLLSSLLDVPAAAPRSSATKTPSVPALKTRRSQGTHQTKKIVRKYVLHGSHDQE